MSEEEFQKNVLGEKLEECSNNPLTGLEQVAGEGNSCSDALAGELDGWVR